MTTTPSPEVLEAVAATAQAARAAATSLARCSGPERRSVLLALADALGRSDVRQRVLAANAQDRRDAEAARERGELSVALVDRVALGESKIDALCDGLVRLAGQGDLLGRTTLRRELDKGLVLSRVTCPLGVLGVVFEARPDAVPQITGLALRTGNAVVLKGGREARRSNAALVAVIRDTLAAQGFDPAAVALLEGREEVDALLRQERTIDLVVARGSSSFVHHVMRSTQIPVLGHAEGLCHLFVHASANVRMTAALAHDAKCGYPAACNAIETLLWEPGAQTATAGALRRLAEAGVELRVCSATRAMLDADDKAKSLTTVAATDDDWGTEYGDLVLAVRRVDGLGEALRHIARHGSRHTEAIVADDAVAAAAFVAEVDAASVFHNASTRFADGYRFGLGAELGISTGKLHARGPVGTEGLVTYRWLLAGDGHVAGEYGGPDGKRFTHKDLD